MSKKNIFFFFGAVSLGLGLTLTSGLSAKAGLNAVSPEKFKKNILSEIETVENRAAQGVPIRSAVLEARQAEVSRKALLEREARRILKITGKESTVQILARSLGELEKADEAVVLETLALNKQQADEGFRIGSMLNELSLSEPRETFDPDFSDISQKAGVLLWSAYIPGNRRGLVVDAINELMKNFDDHVAKIDETLDYSLTLQKVERGSRKGIRVISESEGLPIDFGPIIKGEKVIISTDKMASLFSRSFEAVKGIFFFKISKIARKYEGVEVTFESAGKGRRIRAGVDEEFKSPSALNRISVTVYEAKVKTKGASLGEESSPDADTQAADVAGAVQTIQNLLNAVENIYVFERYGPIKELSLYDLGIFLSAIEAELDLIRRALLDPRHSLEFLPLRKRGHLLRFRENIRKFISDVILASDLGRTDPQTLKPFIEDLGKVLDRMRLDIPAADDVELIKQGLDRQQKERAVLLLSQMGKIKEKLEILKAEFGDKETVSNTGRPEEVLTMIDPDFYLAYSWLAYFVNDPKVEKFIGKDSARGTYERPYRYQHIHSELDMRYDRRKDAYDRRALEKYVSASEKLVAEIEKLASPYTAQGQSLGTAKPVTLRQRIIDRISQSPLERITFAEYQEMALFAPPSEREEGGYFMEDRIRLGQTYSHDGTAFVTMALRPDVDEAFAKYFYQLWTQLGRPQKFDIVEQGAGDGTFALYVLDSIQRLYPDFFKAVHYTIIEISDRLMELQKDKLRDLFAVNFVKGSVFDMPLPDNSIEGVFFSNELPDTFPVHRLRRYAAGYLKEIYVRYDKNRNIFMEEEGEVTQPVAEYVKKYGLPESGTEAAINVKLIEWLDQVNRKLKKGWVVTSDYLTGTREDADHEDFMRSNYPNENRFKPSAYNFDDKNILEPGVDITHHVSFSDIQEIGKSEGFETELRSDILDFMSAQTVPLGSYEGSRHQFYSFWVLSQSKGVAGDAGAMESHQGRSLGGGDETVEFFNPFPMTEVVKELFRPGALRGDTNAIYGLKQHHRRVAELMGQIADDLKLDPFEKGFLVLLAWIHDIGKGISEEEMALHLQNIQIRTLPEAEQKKYREAFKQHSFYAREVLERNGVKLPEKFYAAVVNLHIDTQFGYDRNLTAREWEFVVMFDIVDQFVALREPRTYPRDFQINSIFDMDRYVEKNIEPASTRISSSKKEIIRKVYAEVRPALIQKIDNPSTQIVSDGRFSKGQSLGETAAAVVKNISAASAPSYCLLPASAIESLVRNAGGTVALKREAGFLLSNKANRIVLLWDIPVSREASLGWLEARGLSDFVGQKNFITDFSREAVRGDKLENLVSLAVRSLSSQKASLDSVGILKPEKAEFTSPVYSLKNTSRNALLLLHYLIQIRGNLSQDLLGVFERDSRTGDYVAELSQALETLLAQQISANLTAQAA